MVQQAFFLLFQQFSVGVLVSAVSANKRRCPGFCCFSNEVSGSLLLLFHRFQELSVGVLASVVSASKRRVAVRVSAASAIKRPGPCFCFSAIKRRIALGSLFLLF